MRRIVLVGVGFLLTLAGVIFTLQGVGVLGGSVMSGVTFWAVAGPAQSPTAQQIKFARVKLHLLRVPPRPGPRPR